jgi:hypothetical protein
VFESPYVLRDCHVFLGRAARLLGSASNRGGSFVLCRGIVPRVDTISFRPKPRWIGLAFLRSRSACILDGCDGRCSVYVVWTQFVDEPPTRLVVTGVTPEETLQRLGELFSAVCLQRLGVLVPCAVVALLSESAREAGIGREAFGEVACVVVEAVERGAEGGVQ